MTLLTGGWGFGSGREEVRVHTVCTGAVQYAGGPCGGWHDCMHYTGLGLGLWVTQRTGRTGPGACAVGDWWYVECCTLGMH